MFVIEEMFAQLWNSRQSPLPQFLLDAYAIRYGLAGNRRWASLEPGQIGPCNADRKHQAWKDFRRIRTALQGLRGSN